MSKILIHEDNFSDSSDCEIDEDVEGYLVVKESYCMACDSPLKSYHSLICSECLHDKAKELSQMVDDLNEDIKKYVFIDPDYSDSGIEIYFDNEEEGDQDEEEEEILEEEWTDEDEDEDEDEFFNDE